MKKILIMLLAVLLFLPTINTFAYTGGLLNGKNIYIGSSPTHQYTITGNVTDNNTTTTYREIGASGSNEDVFWYAFPTPIEIDQYQIKAAGTALNFRIHFFDEFNNIIETIQPNNIDSIKSNNLVNGLVKKVALENISSSVRAVYEFDVFNSGTSQPIINHETISDLLETHNYNTVNLSWVNPTATGFTGTIIKQNGVEVTQLPKTTSSYSINNLNENTTYNYEIIAKYSDGVNSAPLSKSVTTDSAPLPPEPVGEVIDLSATATHERVNLSWTLPESEELKHVNIYRDTVIETSLLDTLLGTSRAYAAETKIFETNGTYFNDLTVDEQTTYEYTLTTTSTAGVESEGVTTEVTTPEAPAPEIVGGGYEKDPLTGDFTYYWTEPIEGEVKVLVGGTEYRKVAASTKQIVIPASEMKYTAFGDPNVTLIPIDSDGDEGAPIKPPLNGEGSADSIGNVDIPFSASELLKSGMGLFIIIAPFVLLALSFLLVPKLRFLIVQAFTKKEHREERKRRFESETRERKERQQRERTEREQRAQRERAERKERLHFKEKTIGSKGSRESVIVKAERAPKERKERAERQSRSTRGKTERASRERTPRTERGFR